MIYAVNKRTKEHRAGVIIKGPDWVTVQADDEGWIEWHGGECPLPVETMINVKTTCDAFIPEDEMTAGSCYWGRNTTITHYRPILKQEQHMTTTAHEDQFVTYPNETEWKMPKQGYTLSASAAGGGTPSGSFSVNFKPGQIKEGDAISILVGGGGGPGSFGHSGNGGSVECQTKKWRGPEDGLPPVGLVCEYLSTYWLEAEVIAHRENCAIVWTDEGGYFSCVASRFRPIRTDRERWVEAAKEVVSKSNAFLVDEYEAIHDALQRGDLLMPEEK